LLGDRGCTREQGVISRFVKVTTVSRTPAISGSRCTYDLSYTIQWRRHSMDTIHSHTYFGLSAGHQNSALRAMCII